MKRTALAGILSLLAGAFTLLLVASILYSCRSGEDPHNTRSSGSLSTVPAQKTQEPGQPPYEASHHTSSASVLRLSSLSDQPF